LIMTMKEKKKPRRDEYSFLKNFERERRSIITQRHRGGPAFTPNGEKRVSQKKKKILGLQSEGGWKGWTA